ncbi:MAG: preprotein translocase subunit SecE [Dermatophilaceae bacterium]
MSTQFGATGITRGRADQVEWWRTAPTVGELRSVADDSVTRSRSSVAASGPGPAGSRRGGVLSVGRFIRQILDELRKVVRPTRHEWTTYTIVVITFVVTVMMIVFGFDTVFTKLVFWVFAGSGS